MNFIGFDDLRVGQFVKISGTFRDGEGFLAVEITSEAAPDDVEMECVIQKIDHQRKQLRFFNREIALPDEIEVKDLAQNRVGLKALQPGQMAKLKGTYSESAGFVLKKIKIQAIRDFNIEQLQGVVAKIGREKKTLLVNGIAVWVTAKTNIEGLE